MKNKLGLLLMAVLVTGVWAQDFRVALPGYRYQFPRDYFDHPEYQTEWWYYTGNVKSSDGHRFGFELTFFRQGISRSPKTSPWQIRDLYMAHLAISDLSGHRFYHTERINRAGPGIAGIDQRVGRIWNGNWQVQIREHDQHLLGRAENFGVEFDLKPQKSPVIHGPNGISQKAEGIGHASHYISFTRLLTTGSIDLHGTTYKVDGTSWMDHEFFTESMASTENGWDWLSLQLNDGTELMLYRLRHRDGTIDPYSSGTYVDARGKSTFLSSKDFTMAPVGETWTSPQSSGTYPIQWHVSIPSLSLQIGVATPLPNQELVSKIGPSYWEGAVDVSAQRAGIPLTGIGYLEMTGYGAARGSTVLP